MKCLLILVVLSVVSAQFFNPNIFSSTSSINPNVGFNSLFGGLGALTSNPAIAYRSTNPALAYSGITGTGLGLSTNAITGTVSTGIGGYGNVARSDGRIYNAASCNYLFGSNSIITFCSRYTQACNEIMYSDVVSANTVNCCSGCTMNFNLNCRSLVPTSASALATNALNSAAINNAAINNAAITNAALAAGKK